MNLGKIVSASEYGGGAVYVHESSTENKPAWGEKREERDEGEEEGTGGNELLGREQRESVSVTKE